jgi:ABC-type multidrug transport system ATPase subunit
MTGNMQVILVAHRIEEVVSNITHVLFIKSGQIFMQGPKSELFTSKNISLLYDSNLQVEKRGGTYVLSYDRRRRRDRSSFGQWRDDSDLPDILIEMKNTTVRYGTYRSGPFELTVEEEKLGHYRTERLRKVNHSGTDSGDNLQGYSNEITLFGKLKGSGETLWEIRITQALFHRNFRSSTVRK